MAPLCHINGTKRQTFSRFLFSNDSTLFDSRDRDTEKSSTFNERQYSVMWTIFTSYSTILLLARSALFPASAITMLGLACLCNSFTHVFARPNVSCELKENIHTLFTLSIFLFNILFTLDLDLWQFYKRNIHTISL